MTAREDLGGFFALGPCRSIEAPVTTAGRGRGEFAARCGVCEPQKWSLQ